jgi:hypothetical protein
MPEVWKDGNTRTWYGRFMLGLIILVWCSLAMAFPPLGYVGAVICFVCATVSVLMNGMQNQDTASPLFTAAGLALVAAWIGQVLFYS